jgi:hypothetical protein
MAGGNSRRDEDNNDEASADIPCDVMEVEVHLVLEIVLWRSTIDVADDVLFRTSILGWASLDTCAAVEEDNSSHMKEVEDSISLFHSEGWMMLLGQMELLVCLLVLKRS